VERQQGGKRSKSSCKIEKRLPVGLNMGKEDAGGGRIDSNRRKRMEELDVGEVIPVTFLQEREKGKKGVEGNSRPVKCSRNGKGKGGPFIMM